MFQNFEADFQPQNHEFKNNHERFHPCISCEYLSEGPTQEASKKQHNKHDKYFYETTSVIYSILLK